MILISRDGIIIRIQVCEIRECARPSKGVRVMKISEENKVVAVATVPHEDEVEDTEVVSESESK